MRISDCGLTEHESAASFNPPLYPKSAFRKSEIILVLSNAPRGAIMPTHFARRHVFLEASEFEAPKLLF
jgi:hypothetical protein